MQTTETPWETQEPMSKMKSEQSILHCQRACQTERSTLPNQNKNKVPILAYFIFSNFFVKFNFTEMTQAHNLKVK